MAQQVEVSIRANDMLIGTVLRSLEIEDLVSCSTMSRSCYLARSFIGRVDAHSTSDDVSNDIEATEGDDQFFEAPESLADSGDFAMQSPRIFSGDLSNQMFHRSKSLWYKLPSFTHISGLLPTDVHPTSQEDLENTDILDSFVKAQIVIRDQNSPRYNNIDKQVHMLL